MPPFFARSNSAAVSFLTAVRVFIEYPERSKGEEEEEEQSDRRGRRVWNVRSYTYSVVTKTYLFGGVALNGLA